MNKEIKDMFTDFTVNSKKIEVAHIKYNGSKDTYVVWTIIEDEPFFAYDDEIQYSLVTIDMDIYCKGNYLNILKKIKKIMKNNEWTWIEDSEEMYEDDTKLYHITSTFEKERKIKWQEED